ncbi:MAG: cation:proton antiporter, partial [Bacteriovoracaceae bacterium]
MTNFLETVLYFLGAALIIVPIFNRLGFGSVLGYLMAGIIVGPQGLGMIRHVEATFHFAEYGVIFLLFIIGLEIRPQKLIEMRKRLATLGLFQVALCSLVLTIAVKTFIDLPWMVASVVGFSLSLSSTAFALQTLEERNEFKTDHGQAAFTILLTQDLLAIPVLAIVPMIWPKGGVESSGPLWLFPFVLIGLYVLSRFFIRPLFRHLAETHSREIFTVSALFIVLGVSAVMINIGLSAALGAFIAGVFL